MFVLQLVACLSLFCGGPEMNQSAPPGVEVGDPAPEFEFASWLRAPVGAPDTLAELRGRWVILDFFAPWCPGCRAGIDHVNALADAFPDESVTVISVCSESRAVMLKSQERSPLRTWVAIDDDSATAAAWQIGGYPQAALIDPEGVVAGFVRPSSLTIERMTALLSGAEVELPHERRRASGLRGDTEWDTGPLRDPDAITQIVLRYSPASERGFLRYRDTPGRIFGDGVRFAEAARACLRRQPLRNAERDHEQTALPGRGDITHGKPRCRPVAAGRCARGVLQLPTAVGVAGARSCRVAL